MKHYKLLKDLPTFKAGDEFYINGFGHLYSVDGEHMIYSNIELEKFPNILKDWFKEMQEGSYLTENGEIFKYNEDEDPYCLNYRRSIGNDFKTEEEVMKYRGYLIALQTIKDDTKGFVPDWENFNQSKYYGKYNYKSGCLDWDEYYHVQFQGAIYFKTKKDIEESFKKHRKEWLMMFVGGK